MSGLLQKVFWAGSEDVSMLPKGCPVCGSVGTGKFMPQHILGQHQRDVCVEVLVEAVEAEARAAIEEKFLYTPANHTTEGALEAFRRETECRYRAMYRWFERDYRLVAGIVDSRYLFVRVKRCLV